MKDSLVQLIKDCGLRDTQARRLVLKALANIKGPLTHKKIHQWIVKQKAAVNLTTIYRILATFEERGLVHRHPSSNGVVLCTLPEEHGHHVLLSCEACGKVEEQVDDKLCHHEDSLARRKGFVPKTHISEIIGLCPTCNS